MNKENYSILLDKDFREEFFNKAISKFGSQTNLAKYLNKKIKGRKIIRENIKGWIRGKHIKGWNILVPIDVIKELCNINSENSNFVLSHIMKFNPPWIDPKKQILLVKHKPISIVKENNSFYLDLATVLPRKSLEAQRSRKRLPLFSKVNEEYILLWSEASWKKSEIRLKRFVKLDDLFFKGCAIFISEGTNKTNKGAYNGSLNLGNSEPAIVKIFLEWLNSFLIDYNVSYKVEYNGTNVNYKKVREFWSKNLNVPNNLIKIRLRNKYGSNLINNFGTLNIKIDSTILKSFIINLLKISRKIVFKNKKWQISYLKGLLASEGSVNNNNVLKEVTIGSTNTSERVFIKKLLKKLELKYCDGKNQISILNWKSFYRLFTYQSFEINQINNYSKKDRFFRTFKNHNKTKKLIRLIPFKSKTFAANDWQNHYNLKSYISAHKYLSSLVKENFLKINFIKNKKYYFINNNKLNELEKIWAL